MILLQVTLITDYTGMNLNRTNSCLPIEAIYSAEVNQEVMEPAEVSNDDEMLENEDSQEGGVSL